MDNHFLNLAVTISLTGKQLTVHMTTDAGGANLMTFFVFLAIFRNEITHIFNLKELSGVGGSGHVFRFEGPGYKSAMLIYIMYKNAQYRSQFWTDFHEIYMIGAGLPRDEP